MAESKGLYQPWRHEAFMADRKVRKMTPIELKTYMLLLHEAFVCETRPNLPDNEDDLEEMALCTNHEEWLSIREVVLGMFEKTVVDDIPVLTRKRLTDDWGHLQEIREARSEAGKASAAKRKSTNVERLLTNEHKEVSKEVSEEKEESENEETDMNLKPFKASLTVIAAKHNVALGGYDETIKNLKLLADSFGSGAVLNDFDAYLSEKQGEEFFKGAASAYLSVAPYRLAEPQPGSVGSSSDPEVVSLARAIMRASQNEITLLDKQKIRLSEALSEGFTADEILAGFKEWFSKQDVAKDGPFLAGKFAQQAADLAYGVRESRVEAEKQSKVREAAVRRLQEEAEAERLRVAEEKDKEEDIFDPLSE